MKLYGVQFARGAAALIVVVSHAINHPLALPDMTAIRFGRLGVILFFIISGFIMVYVTGTSNFNPWVFLKRRFLRIVPYYWLVTSVLAVIAIAAPNLLKTTVFSVDHYIMSLLFIPHLDSEGSVAPLLKLGWTLNYEIFFYLVFALFARTLIETRVSAISLIFGLLVICGFVFDLRSTILIFYSNHIIVSFCLGMIVGTAMLKGKLADIQNRNCFMLWTGLLVSLVLAMTLEPGDRGSALVNAFLMIAAMCGLLLTIRYEKLFARFPKYELVGDASYSIYLVHLYWIGLVTVLMKTSVGNGSYFLSVILGVVGSLVAGVAAYLLVEKQLLKILFRKN